MAERLARATLTAGKTTLIMPINPYTANWGYQENTVSRDTLGGRVVQLLSVAITDLSVQSVAGSRAQLQKVAESARRVMEYHVSTLQPATFRVPSRAWDFRVYLTAMPQMGWDVASTTYPYQLQMSIDEDISGIKKKEMEAAALLKLYKGVGYNPHVHGGDAGAFNKLVKTVLKSSQTVGGSGGGGGGGTVDLSGGSFGEAALRVALPFKGGQYLLGGFDAPGGGTISGGVGDAAQGTTDCSGLTEYAYRRGAGLEIGSTANCQYRSAQASNVFFNDRAKLQTGDLMFYNFGGSASCADHVALWVSNARGGTIFHAHSSSSPIEYSYNYGWSSWMGAARPADGFKIVGGCVCR